MLNKTLTQRNYFCIAFCIKPTHFSPNTATSPSQRDRNRLKTHVPQNDVPLHGRVLILGG